LADFKTLKKKSRNRLGIPPTPASAGSNLQEPETAPATYVDGRSLRKTGRVAQFSTRVTPEWHRRIKLIAARDTKKLNEVLELALEAYEEKYGRLPE